MTIEGIILFIIAPIFILILLVSAPFPVWRNALKLSYFTFINPDIPLLIKLRLFAHLACSLVALFIKSLFWRIDSFIYSRTYPKNIVMIIGSPRSGTTYLHRILEQHEAFHALTYMQMRYPSETIWRLFDFFGLTKHIRKRSYWPRSSDGELAEKLHKHTFEDKEEIGMFLEEILMSHFFLYRRFPSPEIVEGVANLEKLSRSQWIKIQKCVDGLLRRSLHYTGEQDKTVLLKENESVAFFAKMRDLYPNIKFVFIYRPTEQIASSYQNLSLVSTKVKTGIDPRSIEGWQEANDQFRVNEFANMIDFYRSLPNENKVLVSYENLVQNPVKEINYVLAQLHIEIGERYTEFLENQAKEQSNREKGYTNSTHVIDYDGKYDVFFQSELQRRC